MVELRIRIRGKRLRDAVDENEKKVGAEIEEGYSLGSCFGPGLKVGFSPGW